MSGAASDPNLPAAGDAQAERARVRQMLQTMLSLQESHNLLVAEDWRTRALPFHRAIWVECAELLDHFGWKWWKHQAPDLGQVRLELVDIWHFGLSCLMLRPDLDLADIASGFLTLRTPSADAGDAEAFRQHVERLARAALDREFAVEHFVATMGSLPMAFAELFEVYVGKNVLNRFRQTHGYASGQYRKLWGGREDNVHLLELTATLASDRTDYIEALHAALAARYHETADTGGRGP